MTYTIRRFNMKNESILNINVSCFTNCSSTIPTSVNLLSWLTSDIYRDTVGNIRNIQDEELQKVMKASLPAITPSGVFSYRSEKDLIDHSGFLAFDIDFKDNQHISNFDDLKEQISHIPNVAYCGLSVRGKGYWGLIPIPKSTPEVHKKRFYALIKDLKEYGIILDPSGSDICRLRIYSWDQNAYFNHSAKLYSKLFTRQQKTYYKPAFSDNRRKVEDIISQIKIKKLDITQDYKEDWFQIGTALANEFGEAGRGYFHDVSQFHPKYSVKNTDRMFDGCLRHNYRQVTLASFFYIATKYGIKIAQEPKTVTVQSSFTISKPLSNNNLLCEEQPSAVSHPVSKIAIKSKINGGIWDKQIEELEKFFTIIKLPTGPLRLDQCTLITDISLFINSHLDIVKAHQGNKTFEPYLDRLNQLKLFLSLN